MCPGTFFMCPPTPLRRLMSWSRTVCRFKLLSQIEHFVEHLSAKIVNDQAGMYILENTFRPMGVEGISADVIWGEGEY